MAELFGTAAGVLQVAEVGFNLATTLYKYASTVKGAERDIKRIARDVKLTSKVLERTHQQVKADQQGQLCTDDALFDLEDVLDGCREAFGEVDEALQKAMRSSAGKSSISLTEKLKWPLKQDKLEVLRANLEKLKTTLLLMLSVLAYGSKVQQSQVSKTDIKVELSLEKLQIQNLIQAKDEATNRYEELSAAFSKLEARINDSAQKVPSVSSIEANTISMMAMPSHGLPPLEPNSSHRDQSDDHQPHVVSVRLGLCASAVSRLTTTIDAATKRWQSHQILEHDDISVTLKEATDAIASLKQHAVNTSASLPNADAVTGQESCQDNDSASNQPAGPTRPLKSATDNHQVQDYQMQLILLEKQNKKRLLMARQEQDSHLPDSQASPSDPSVLAGALTGEPHGELHGHVEEPATSAAPLDPFMNDHFDLPPLNGEEIPLSESWALASGHNDASSGQTTPNVTEQDSDTRHPHEADVSPAPLSALEDDDLNLDFGNADSGDVLDNFDFDSFLKNTGDDDGLGIDATFSFGESVSDRPTEQDISMTSTPAQQRNAPPTVTGASAGAQEESGPCPSQKATSMPSIAQTATGGLAGAATEFGLPGLLNKVSDKRDQNRMAHRDHRRSSVNATKIEREPIPEVVAREQVKQPNEFMDPDEEYRWRMMQVQKELGRTSSEPRDTVGDPDPDRERRRREREERRRDRKIRDVHSIHDTQSDRRENRVRIVNPGAEQDDEKPKGILKKPSEKFPDDPSATREGLTTSLQTNVEQTNVKTDINDEEGGEPLGINADSQYEAAEPVRQENRTRGKSDSHSGHRPSNGEDQRDYILDLAGPERAPTTGVSANRQRPLPARFQCRLCSKRFTRAYNLRSHMVAMHKDQLDHGHTAVAESGVFSTPYSATASENKIDQQETSAAAPASRPDLDLRSAVEDYVATIAKSGSGLDVDRAMGPLELHGSQGGKLEEEENEVPCANEVFQMPELLTPDQPLSHSFVVSGPEPRVLSPPPSPDFSPIRHQAPSSEGGSEEIDYDDEAGEDTVDEDSEGDDEDDFDAVDGLLRRWTKLPLAA